MAKQVTVRKSLPARRRWVFEKNTMGFPRALREAIPDLPTSIGRVLKIDSMNGHATNTTLFGPGVHLKVVVKETGRLKGEFVIRMDLEPIAARRLAETLLTLATRPRSRRNNEQGLVGARRDGVVRRFRRMPRCVTHLANRHEQSLSPSLVSAPAPSVDRCYGGLKLFSLGLMTQQQPRDTSTTLTDVFPLLQTPLPVTPGRSPTSAADEGEPVLRQLNMGPVQTILVLR
jgi:hypothetical protein